jgi:hypothetical protein
MKVTLIYRQIPTLAKVTSFRRIKYVNITGAILFKMKEPDLLKDH